jgi:hypothetical protein
VPKHSEASTKAAQLAAAFFCAVLNGLWAWASLVAYFSIEQLRFHCRTLTAEQAAASLVTQMDVKDAIKLASRA